MRFFIALASAYMLTTASAAALDAGDAMRAWLSAPASEKDRLLDLLGGASLDGFSKPAVHACLDEAAKLTAHEDLPIAVVFKACAAQASGQKV